MSRFYAVMASYFERWFHKRNIIIVSERKVKHVPISGALQFSVLALTVTGVCWASYSTGSFMAARLALKEQSRTLRSVTNARIESNFSSVYGLAPIVAAQPVVPPAAAAASMANTLSDPMFTLSALDHDKLYARIAYLEYKVEQLKDNNQAIIDHVREKTGGGIEALENVIRHTGLSPDVLKKQAENKSKAHHDGDKSQSANAEGGPYIPDNLSNLSDDEYQMYADLDTLALLRHIVGALPLAAPIAHAERTSPFGRRIDPFNGHLAFHPGVDLAAPFGTPIHATAAGTVAAAGPDGGYGNAVDIDHGFGLMTRYGHMSKVLVKVGEDIKEGQIIGLEGCTGRCTGPHVHYEVHYHGRLMNPENFLHAGNYVSEKDD